MGYSHYWQRPTELSAAAFTAAAADSRELLKTTGIPLAGFDGTGNPAFDPGHIVFNGRGPYGCEPFEIIRIEFDRRGGGAVRSYCKTEHQPYDLCVKVALVILAHHLGDALVVCSDGGDADWADARARVQLRFGYGGDFRLQHSD